MPDQTVPARRRWLVPLAVALLAACAFLLVWFGGRTGEDLIPDQDHIVQCYVRLPDQAEYPAGGGFSYILEGEELRDFLALLNGAQFHRAVYGRSGGSKMVPGSPYELNIIYDEGLPALLTVTDAGYLELRTVSEDHPTAFPVGEGLYRIGSGDIVGFLTAH